MGDYQYYEFQAIDRPLTRKEQDYVSNLSSRTTATAYNAIFLYHYSSLRADPINLLAKYFDAYLYLSNWGMAQLAFRFPANIVDIKELEPYTYEHDITLDRLGDYIILDMTWNEEEGGFGWVDGEGYLPRMLELRQAIMNGDFRVLYLAWLKVAGMYAGYEYMQNKTALEPPVPANLGQLTPALATFMDFFEIDETLVKVAAQASPKRHAPKIDIEAGLQSLTLAEKDAYLRRLLKGEANLAVELTKRFQALTAPDEATPSAERRTIQTILEEHDAVAQRIKEEKRREAERKRNEYLDSLQSRISILWDRIYFLIDEKKAKPYDEAVELLVDLRELAQRDSWEEDFQDKIDDIRKTYKQRSALIRRLDKNKLV